MIDTGMAQRYLVIGTDPDAELHCSTAVEFFNRCKDMDEPDEPGTFTLHARTGSDGIGISGTLPELTLWLERAMQAVGEAAKRDVAHQCALNYRRAQQ